MKSIIKDNDFFRSSVMLIALALFIFDLYDERNLFVVDITFKFMSILEEYSFGFFEQEENAAIALAIYLGTTCIIGIVVLKLMNRNSK
ncbi:hypothetical protein [Leptospira santarosai]|uniref:hypothetical protein n=1 Tax=Leptospira santarosai TaxID=28183 RepID=UPI0005189167|nr:hypothetical protein [Leptospira santarosai]